MWPFLSTLAVLGLLCCVSARPFFPKLIPNGGAAGVPGSGITCAYLGHNNCQPPMNNKFGLHFRAAGFQWTRAFCMQDSDGDGLTNGEELGDPCCEWTTANQKLSRRTNLSHPGDASQKAAGVVTCTANKTALFAADKPSLAMELAAVSSTNVPITAPVAPTKKALPTASTSSVSVSVPPAPVSMAATVLVGATSTPSASNSVALRSKAPLLTKRPTSTPTVSKPAGLASELSAAITVTAAEPSRSRTSDMSPSVSLAPIPPSAVSSSPNATVVETASATPTPSTNRVFADTLPAVASIAPVPPNMTARATTILTPGISISFAVAVKSPTVSAGFTSIPTFSLTPASTSTTAVGTAFPDSPIKTVPPAPGCFPGNASVRLANGSIVRVSALAIGDHVEVAPGVYNTVFMFTHKLEEVHSEFVSIRTRHGALLHLSQGHFMYLNVKLAPESEVRPGDVVEVDGWPDEVVIADRAVKKGLYNPQTICGDIVVDRVRVATYTTAFQYGGAQAALTPFRAIYRSFGISFQSFDKGVRHAFLP